MEMEGGVKNENNETLQKDPLLEGAPSLSDIIANPVVTEKKPRPLKPEEIQALMREKEEEENKMGPLEGFKKGRS